MVGLIDSLQYILDSLSRYCFEFFVLPLLSLLGGTYGKLDGL